MRRILILFAHPRYELSRTHRALCQALPQAEWLTFRDLYELYPDYDIDVEVEKEALQASDLIIWQHPFYWYSAPPLLKQWIDVCLEFKWAYGPGGEALKGKYLLTALSSGGTREVYQPEGRNRYTLAEFLRPFEQTVRLCHMTYLPPFAVQGTHRLSPDDLGVQAAHYRDLLALLANPSTDLNELLSYDYSSDWLEAIKTTQR